MKKYIYNVTLEDGRSFDYTMDAATFNEKLEDGSNKSSLITSFSFVKETEIDEEHLSNVVDAMNQDALDQLDEVDAQAE